MTPQTNTPQVDGMAVDYSALPERLRDAMRLWIEKGIDPGTGTGLKMILAHDLFAVLYCDGQTVAELPPILRWLHNHAPSGCHGNAKVVDAWGKWRRSLVMIR